MLDGIEAAFAAINTPLHAAYTTINILKEDTPAVSVFPCVIINEIDNSETARNLGNTENAANIALQFDIYSNKTSGNLAERLAILAIVDTAVRAIGYYRVTVNSNAPNIDPNIKRTLARYAKLAV